MKALLTALTLTIAATAVQAQNVHERYGSPVNVSDMVLIYAGNSNRNVWDETQLAPYVTHVYADGTEDWMFDSFLFLEFVRTRQIDGVDTTFGFGNGMGGDKAATQKDWAWILDEYFADSLKLTALDRLIGCKIDQLGQPPFRHKVVIVCPAPKKAGNVWSAEPWGTIDGTTIALDTEANRLAAVKWYIDSLLERWDKAGYENIDLEGVYWIEESMISNAGIIADVNDYARSRGLRSYWIPYYRSGNETFCSRWESDFKFDHCYFQPNYAFYQAGGETLPKSQLVNTCRGAKTYGAGLELEFETSGRSNALHSVDPAAHQRINDYMDVYTAEGVFDSAGVAYYVGSRGLNDMAASTDSVDHATIDRMAQIVRQRHLSRPAATVTRDSTATVFTTLTEDGEMTYTFCRCMANNLYTFADVSIDGCIINSARESDNIGPFLVKGHGWIGGNHLSDSGALTAKTVDVSVKVDGKPLEQGSRQGRAMEVNVVNELYMPDGSVFAVESVRYLVAGNSIEVWATHDYKHDEPLNVERYYGMQSMFIGETELLLPGVQPEWVPVVPDAANNSIRIKKGEAPYLPIFIEHSPTNDVYQATYMIAEDLGDRSLLTDDDEIFVGNSYGKSYHKLMSMHEVHPGQTTRWHGVYSWFRKPKADTPALEYTAYLSGRPTTINVTEPK